MLLSALPHAMIPYDKCECMSAKYRVLRPSKGNVFFTCFIDNNALDTFLFISFIHVCFFHVRFSSRCIPRNLEHVSRPGKLLRGHISYVLVMTRTVTIAIIRISKDIKLINTT